MKMRVHILSFIFLVLFCQGCFQLESKVDISSKQSFNLQSVDDLYSLLTYDANRYPLISAHRGGPVDQFPENAIETFAYQTKRHPLIIECDVRMTKDSVLVLLHDETLDRTTDGKGRLNKATYEEVSQLYLKDNKGNITKYRIPTLEKALKWGKEKVIYTLDVKKEVPYSLVVDLIKKTQSEANCIIITYSATQAGQVHSLAPDLMISATIKNMSDIGRLSNFGIPDNRLVAFVGTKEAPVELINQLHSHGIMVILGTIGNLDKKALRNGHQTYAELIENGADILSTDEPALAQKALNYYISKRNISSRFIK